MCHLLGDMSVPAHAHCDIHGDNDPGILYDSYEEYFGTSYYWNGQNSGQMINPYVSSNPLHYLMYTMSQISGHFGSNGPYNGDGDNNIGGNPLPEETAFLNQTLPSMPTSLDGYNIMAMRGDNAQYTENIKIAIRDWTLPYAIRATAGLLYWFAKEACLLPELPNQPTALTASTGNWGFVELSWDIIPTCGLTGFSIYRRTAGQNDEALLTSVGADVRIYHDLTIEQHPAEYEYRIAAYNSNNYYDPLTPWALGWAYCYAVPLPPNFISATRKSDHILLSWSGAGGSLTGIKEYLIFTTKYHFYYNGWENEYLSDIVTTDQRDGSATLDALGGCNDKAKYRIRTMNVLGFQSDFSDYSQEVDIGVCPEPATYISASDSLSNEVEVSWAGAYASVGSTIQGYKLYRSDDYSGDTLLTTIYTGDSYSTFHDSAVEFGTVYHYKVVTIDNQDHESLPSETVSGQTSCAAW